jgi:stage V sporulation protein AE
MFHVKQGVWFMELFLNCLWAFLVGGGICVIGQLLIDCTKLTPARILVSFVVLGVLLTAIGLYDPLVEFAGAGATVPLTGFGYSLAKGVQVAVTEHGLIGALMGGLEATAAGITASVLFGFIAALLVRPDDKT